MDNLLLAVVITRMITVEEDTMIRERGTEELQMRLKEDSSVGAVKRMAQKAV